VSSVSFAVLMRFHVRISAVLVTFVTVAALCAGVDSIEHRTQRDDEAIRAATSNAAKVLRAEKSLGSIEAGKLADLVAWRKDPLADVSVLATPPILVRKGGVVVAGTR